MLPALSTASPATERSDAKEDWLAGSSVAPAPRPKPVSERYAVLPFTLFTVSGVERAPGTAGVNPEASRQSAVESAFMVQAGVLSDHSLELATSPFVEARLSPGAKCS